MYNHLGEGEPKDAKDGGKKKSSRRRRSKVEEDQCTEEGWYSVINVNVKIKGMAVSEDAG
jgi:hypothetical protein